MINKRPVVGQVLYSLNIGDAARCREQVLTPVVVKKVGRVYFTTGKEGVNYMDTQYHLDTWQEKTDFSAHSALYLDPQSYEDEKEGQQICKGIWNAFEYGRNRRNLPLFVLRQIERLIG